MNNNPFFKNFNQTFNSVPFNEYKSEHFIPAIKEAINICNTNLQAIIERKEDPTFKNTILAFETASEDLDFISGIYWHLYGAESDSDFKKLSDEISPMLAKHQNSYTLNKVLFEKIKDVFSTKNGCEDDSDLKLTEDFYTYFKRNGAELNDSQKDSLREIDEKLSKLSPAFSKNVLDAQNEFELWINDKEELDGLPDGVINAASHAAKQKGKENSWLFTLQFPSFGPFITYSTKRNLREKMIKEYGSLCNGGQYNNNDFVKDIVKYKHKRAQLLGYKNHADFVLDRRMAKNVDNVYGLLDKLFDYSYGAAGKEMDELKIFAKKLDGITDFSQWDLAYYKEKLKKIKYGIDSELLRPYFKAENVINGIFACAKQMYGLDFKELSEIQVWHEDVRCFEVSENNSEHVGLIYIDLFPRSTKRSGAWMNPILENGYYKGKIRRPHVLFVSNVTPSTASDPSLLTFNEVRTIFHEFGHCLHGLLADCKYRSISGTNVFWDFVELPSQIMENWILEKDALELFAKHYKTNEVIPEDLINKIKDSSAFGSGYMSLRQVSLGYLDMAWYTNTDDVDNVEDFEKKAIEKTKLFPSIPDATISNSFGHIFSGGYSAGYYSYKWAEVLEADAFQKFKEDGIFNKDTAKAFRDCILSKGSLKHPMELYKDFRGREPEVTALLKKDRLIS